MDADEVRSILRSTGVDVWTLIESAITFAISDHQSEVKSRRDGIVERLYAPVANLDPIARYNCNGNNNVKVTNDAVREEAKGSSSPIEKVFGASPLTPQSNCRVDAEEDQEVDNDDGDDLIDQERKILGIKDCLEDREQSDEDVVSLLQSLADMDITFKALRETDIGRHVNRLRKHSSNEVRMLVKQLVRKWKEIVDEWVKNNPENELPANNDNEDLPQHSPSKHNQNGNHVAECAYSPGLHNGRMSSNRNSLEPNVTPIPKREAPSMPTYPTPTVSAKVKKQEDSSVDDQRLADARKRLAANYQEAENAKKQRTIQVMDIHEIPKPKNGFISRSKGGLHNTHQSKRR